MQILVVANKQAECARSAALFGPEFSVSTSDDLGDVVYLCKNYGYSAVLLDGMAEASALRLIRSIREARLKTPIVVVLNTHEPLAVARLLNVGADDCLISPVNGVELCARIHAVVRRSSGHADTRIEIGDVIVNLSRQQVEASGKPVTLTASEYRIFEALALRKGSTLSKGQLMNAVYGGLDEPNEKIIDVFICKLRKKLADVNGGDHCIQTVWGQGYMAAPLNPAS